MLRSLSVLAVLLAMPVMTGCEAPALREAVTSTIAAIKVDHTAVDDQDAPPTVPESSEAKGEIEAQPPAKPLTPEQERFRAYAASDGFAARLREAAISSDAYLGRDCAEAYRTTVISILHQPEPPLVMASDAVHPSAGIWRARYSAERCGRSSVYNAVFGGRPGAPPNMRISSPGATRAGSGLARLMRPDILEEAQEAADLDHCGDRRIVDSRASEPVSEVAEDGSGWSRLIQEIWTVDVCGRLVEISLKHGYRDGVQRPQYVIEDAGTPSWKPSGRATAKDVDLIRLQEALLKVVGGNTGASLDYLWAEARREVPFAQTVIAGLYRDGTGLEKDMDRAMFWALRAAYDGYAPAMVMVAEIYETGSWVVRDPRLAAAWYRRAAEAGSEDAKRKLAALRNEVGARNPSPQSLVK